MSNDVGDKIVQLHQQTKSYVDEIKKWVHANRESNKSAIISYFTYSLNISHNPEHESLCLGSYHVQNIGNQPITNPYICIKIPTDSPFSFSGRYTYENFKQSLKNAGGWERLNDKANIEEFWLKPSGKTVIAPDETISFSNFQIKWIANADYAGSIMGFAFSDQQKEGVTVINPINLNGTVHRQEENNE
ncbi:hypothetical protein MKY34_10120 [Sporosarcina sp. FSL K6-1522]|uniref:hypothetical protein n=1 Tax=Sporosarcina sp. FSL K6-1522 TaxID=2921554 RepID=UPI00315A47DC